MLPLKELLFPSNANVAVLSVDVNIAIVRVDVQCTTGGNACPDCGVCSTRVHSSYLRFPVDMPSAGRRVALQLRVRRFRCGNTICPRRTFVEQISGLTRRYGQRTERLRSTLAALGLALAGRGQRPDGRRPRRVRESEHGLAPDQCASLAGSAGAAGGRRRRVRHPQGPPLRHGPGGCRNPPSNRSPPGPGGIQPGGLARTAAGRRGGLPGPSTVLR